MITKAAVVTTAAVTSTVATDPNLPLWARAVFSAAGLVVFAWLWRTFIRRAIDNASLDGARRNKAGWNDFIRSEIFAVELGNWSRHDEQIDNVTKIATSAHAVASANAEVLGTIAGGVAALRTEQDDFRREMRRAIRDAVQHGKYENRRTDEDAPSGDEPSGSG